MKKKFIVNKKETDSSTYDSTTFESTTYDTLTTTEQTETETSMEPNRHRTFFNIATTGYQKPRYGSKQDQLTQRDIREKLVGWKYLPNTDELEYLPLFTTWIKYINKQTGKFRTGGFILRTNLPKYIVLFNPNMNYITWSVQLDENDIYVKDEPVQYDESANETEEERSEREKAIKEKLYQLYLQGRLEKKPKKN